MFWKEELSHNITTVEALSGFYPIALEEQQQLHPLLEEFPMSITRYYLSLINFDDPKDPIARMCIPSSRECDLDGSLDTSGECDNTITIGLQHKYTQTALILSTNQCASYCRHCFRRRLVGSSSEEIMKNFHNMEQYIAQHQKINNILISGGDSFIQDNAVIEQYLKIFTAMPHLDFIRFGTRTPVVFPQRITEDEALIQILKQYNMRKQIYVVTHFNHPNEITKESTLAIRRLKEAGIIVKNQTVLLKGVNDDPDVLSHLLHGLTKIGVVPYYIFQCRPVTGVKSQFQVTLQHGYDIIEQAKAKQNGQGKCLKYIMSHPSGKIEVLGRTKNQKMIFKYHQAKDPSMYGILYEKTIHDTDTWIEEDSL